MARPGRGVPRGRGTGVLRHCCQLRSATSAVRGAAGQHSHAAAMGGRRMLCQTLNAEFAPQNVHVAHVVVDGAVDAPDTLGKMLGAERFQQLREAKGLDKDGLLLPEAIAETYWHLHQQHRSRPFEPPDAAPHRIAAPSVRCQCRKR